MPAQSIDVVAAILFAMAVLHTFSASRFERLATRSPSHAGLLHLLGEVEVVFGFWAIVLVVAMALLAGGSTALDYVETRNDTEPLFVFAVMVVAASRPVLATTRLVLRSIARGLPIRTPVAAAWLGLSAVPFSAR